MADTTTIAEKIAQAETERQRIVANIAAAYDEAEAKGATMPQWQGSANLADTVASIPSTPTLQSKTVTPTTSQQSVTPDSGYDGLSDVTVNATPLEAKTVTPTSQQQVVTPTAPNIGLSSVTVEAAPEDTGENGLYKAMLEGNASNIDDNTLASASGFSFAKSENLVLRKATEMSSFVRGTVSYLKKVVCPLLADMIPNDRWFWGCSNLVDVILPNVTGALHSGSTGNQRYFAECPKLNHIIIGCNYLGYNPFDTTNNVNSIVFTNLIQLSSVNSAALETLVVLVDSATMQNTNAINSNSPIAQGTGYIYVPASDLSGYKSRTNWTVYASQIVGIDEQAIVNIGNTFSPSYSGSSVEQWDIVKLNSWDSATINSATGTINATNEGYLLARGLDTNNVPVYVAYIEVRL